MVLRFSDALFSTQIAEARYYSPENNRRVVPLKVVSAGRERCQPDYRVQRDTFPWWAVELVMSGEGWVEMGNRRFQLQTGMLFCYGPGIRYTMATHPERPLLKYFVDFTGAEALRFMNRGPLRPGQRLQALYPQELQDILDRIITEGNRKSAFSAAIISDYLRIFFQKLHECAQDADGKGPSRALASYLRAQAFLEKNHLHLATVEAAATELGLTAETLCRHFRRFSRTSPYQYLVQLKMNSAVDLLLGTDLLVKEVGQRVGMEDPFHFSRFFKRSKGVSPEAFRRLRQRNSRHVDA